MIIFLLFVDIFTLIFKLSHRSGSGRKKTPDPTLQKNETWPNFSPPPPQYNLGFFAHSPKKVFKKNTLKTYQSTLNVLIFVFFMH